MKLCLFVDDLDVISFFWVIFPDLSKNVKQWINCAIFDISAEIKVMLILHSDFQIFEYNDELISTLIPETVIKECINKYSILINFYSFQTIIVRIAWVVLQILDLDSRCISFASKTEWPLLILFYWSPSNTRLWSSHSLILLQGSAPEHFFLLYYWQWIWQMNRRSTLYFIMGHQI